MRTIGASLIGALAVTVAGSAAASPAFDAFKKICADTHADFAAIKTSLAGKDWTPTEVMPTNMEGVTPSEGVARTSTIGNEHVAVYAWEGMKGQFHLTACTVRIRAFQLGQANDEAKAWLGFASETANGKSTWRYGLTNGAPAAVNMADKTAPQAAASGDGLYFFNVFDDHGEVVLDLLKIKS